MKPIYMLNMRKFITSGLFLLMVLQWGCSSSSQKSNSTNKKSQSKNVEKTQNGLTTFQLKNGIGPVTKAIHPGPLNKEMAARGKEIFQNNCTSCHKIGQRYVGPNLEHVTSRRTPTYIMNMILNPTGMTQKHPVAHKLLEKFASQMANMHLTKKQARAVVEYFRSINSGTSQN